ncbi:unnamed protein product [Fusarium venenatum]|uniref:Uncharacterized protein n=1 Tax=Fusarium venenatum TaxID=56646 RepID=A0A2L2TS84_9HYPO|nr:uncharacterized protein FVRRES_08214 [Fusarium venenatum]CEI68137.1 unnamed protein product [Fusarium venenatum]
MTSFENCGKWRLVATIRTQVDFVHVQEQVHCTFEAFLHCNGQWGMAINIFGVKFDTRLRKQHINDFVQSKTRSDL